jgi:2-polyprenyl-6-methoxyphenol hydroxylase-like FAD-dependent oxidoreductase
MTTNHPNASRAPVIVVGAGPVGLSLALGLARHGVRSIVVERDESTSEQSKAPAVHVRTREIFRQWAVEERFLQLGALQHTLRLHSPGRSPLATIEFGDLEDVADRPGILFLEQGQTERLLLEAVQESGISDVRFATEAVALEQDAEGVRLTFRRGESEQQLEADFVVGSDGSSSFVRGALGLPFEGFTYSVRPWLADVRVSDDRDSLPWPRTRNGRRGLTSSFRLPHGLWRIIRLEAGDVAKGDEVPAEEVSARVAEVLGDGPPVAVEWASRFRIHLRSSPRFRVGRVLLAGDAAHVHSPAGGLGMNAGIQDAHNLAWKLAAALAGGDTERLLQSYEVERHAVAVETVSPYADLMTRAFLQAPSLIRRAAFALMRGVLAVPRLRGRLLRRTSMLDLSYPASPLLDDGERSAGVRLPNPSLRAPDGSQVRLYDLLPVAPVMLEVAEERRLNADLPVDDVIRIAPDAYRDPTGSLRELLGGDDGWIMVRPDAHVAWARREPDKLTDGARRALGAGS